MDFLQFTPTPQNYWRSITLFGLNVASYKFALAKSLMELHQSPNDLVKLEELARPFARNLCEHIASSPKQATSRSSKFLEACRKFNECELDEDQLIGTTVRLGFKNVIDAFHVVNQGQIDCKFFLDERKLNGRIRLTNRLLQMAEVWISLI